MNSTDEAARRARAAFERALRPAPDDVEHPPYETLEALVDGRLDGIDVELVDAHLTACARCAEDVDDLRGVSREIAESVQQPQPAVLSERRRHLRYWLMAGAAAAVIALAVWGTQRALQNPVPPSVEAPETAAALRVETPGASQPNITPDEQAVVARVLTSGRLELPADAATLRGQAGTLLGAPGAATTFGPIEPVGTAIASMQPRFVWRAHPGAAVYTVAVFDEAFTEVARGDRVTGTSWRPSSALTGGRVYLWQVTAHTAEGDVMAPAPPAPEAKLRVLDAAAAAEVASLQQRLADRPLELGVLLARAGLLAEARRVLAGAPAPGPELAMVLR